MRVKRERERERGVCVCVCVCVIDKKRVGVRERKKSALASSIDLSFHLLVETQMSMRQKYSNIPVV